MGYMDQLIDEVLGSSSKGAPPARGKRQKTIHAVISRELTDVDVQRLWDQPAGALSSQPRPVLRLRHSHHMLARLLASGVSNEECSFQTGYESTTISNLKQDPAFKNLIEYYSNQVKEQFLDVHQRLAALSMDATEEIQDRLNAEPESFSNPQLFELLKLGLDRTGHGPTSNLNTNTLVGLITPEQMAQLRDEVSRRQVGQVTQLGLVSKTQPQSSEPTEMGGPIIEGTLARAKEIVGGQSQGPDLPTKGSS